MNFYQELGPLVFGTRLKRLSDYFLSEINEVYVSKKIPFEASWFGVFFLLDKHKSLSIIEISERLEVSHSAISQVIKILEKKKLIITTPSENDGRKKDISFSEKGLELIIEIKPIWVAIEKTMLQLFEDDELLNKVYHLEKEFASKTLSQRINNELDV